MIGRLVRRLFGTSERPGQTRLSQVAALAIARAAVTDERAAGALRLLRVETEDGRTVWTFWTPAIGSYFQVRVDDSTARVITAGRVGAR